MTIRTFHLPGLLALFLGAGLLAGCGSTPDEPEPEEPPAGMTAVQMPDWFDSSQTANEADGYIYGYGMGESSSRRLATQSAQAEGRRAIASYIAAQATGLLEESVQDMGSEAVETARGVFEEFVDQRVHGVRPDRNALYRNEESGDYVAYYRMRVEQDLFNEMMESAINDEELSAELEPVHEDAMELLRQRREEQ